MRFLLLDFLVYVADKILLNQFIVDGGLQLAQLISPGIHVGSHFAEPKGLVDMLCPCVLQIGVENNLRIAVFKQPANEHTQNFSAHTTVLAIGFADFNADFGYTLRYRVLRLDGWSGFRIEFFSYVLLYDTFHVRSKERTNYLLYGVFLQLVQKFLIITLGPIKGQLLFGVFFGCVSHEVIADIVVEPF